MAKKQAGAAAWRERQRDRLEQAVAEQRVLHVTHGDCMDGMACVGLVRRAFPDAEWIGIQPSEVRQMLAWIDSSVALHPGDRPRVLLTDLSPQRDELDDVVLLANRIAQRADLVWLDHHAPQWPDGVAEALQSSGMVCRVDRTGTECGATLTLSFLRSVARQPFGGFRLEADPFDEEDEQAMRAVAHRDTFSDPDDPRGIRMSLVSQRLRADFATLVEHRQYQALDLLAEGPMRRRKRDLEDAMRRIQEEDGLAVVYGPAPISDLAHRYWPTRPEARLLVQFTDDGRMRVRSRPSFPYAQEVARRHGGGGHAHAAGAELVPPRPWRLRAYRALGRLDPRVRRAVREARKVVDEH